jgi:hypothetical protein
MRCLLRRDHDAATLIRQQLAALGEPEQARRIADRDPLVRGETDPGR